MLNMQLSITGFTVNNKAYTKKAAARLGSSLYFLRYIKSKNSMSVLSFSVESSFFMLPDGV